MAIFKCKICGGALEIDGAQSVATCEYCGTKQTLPRLDDERRANLYDRANHFRRNNDFDKAMGIYEGILNEDTTDAEAYWSILLCRYGIEYVKDPATKKRVPTVNRAQFTSIFDDEDYKSAIANADAHQRELYEAEAAAINELQKGILAISQKEEPFDVFICYKETDSNGRRTQDSVLATELYHELTREGFKVFFSRITLEDKLGVAYEPYIFAALHSAKVMVVLGTSPEHFNAVWVKNEWSRYLALIKNGAKKTLIPAYRDMDPYDLPEEFSHLQAQDMSKLGFMQDLLHGIKKMVEAGAPKSTARATAVSTAAPNIEPLLKRAFLFLEDGEFKNAEEYCEKVLDQNPENAQAYLIKLMIDMQVCKPDELIARADLEKNSNFQKAVRFGDGELADRLYGYVLQGKYNYAVSLMNNTEDEETLEHAASLFAAIAGFKDSESLQEKCLELAENHRLTSIYNRGIALFEQEKYDEAISIFESILNYEDAAAQIERCREVKNDTVYELATEAAAFNNAQGVQRAARLFASIPGWRDADEKAAECNAKVAPLLEKERASQKRSVIIGISSIILFLTAIIFIVVYLNSEEYVHRGIHYKKIDNEYHVTAYSGTDTELDVLAEIRGTPVTVIDIDAFENCASLTSITIPDSITSICQRSFSGCSSLVSIIIPGGVTSIGNAAFAGCSSLTSIIIPDSVTSIGGGAFSGCSSLTSITIPDSVTSIGAAVFRNCSSLTSITLPFVGENLDGTGETHFGYAFGKTMDSHNLYVVPSSVKTVVITGGKVIGMGAFWCCSSLTSVIIPDSVTSIGSYAFDGCRSLTSIIIPASVATIGEKAFYSCSGLTSITVAAENTNYYSDGNCLIETASRKLIAGCQNSVIPTDGRVTAIGENAFYNCSGLASIAIPDSVITIGDFAFYKCSSLKTVSFAKNSKLNSIPLAAFYGCSGLTSITIPDSVLSIDESAFSGCSSLTSIIIPANVATIGESAFDDCSGLTSIAVAAGNANYHSAGNCLIKTTSKKLIAGCQNSVIPTDGSVISIGVCAFEGCTGLTSITIPSSVTSIDSSAFRDCTRLTSITIPSSMTGIGHSAFYGCTGLTNVTFVNAEGWWVSISPSAISGTSVDVSSSANNATLLTSTYCDFYWERN